MFFKKRELCGGRYQCMRRGGWAVVAGALILLIYFGLFNQVMHYALPAIGILLIIKGCFSVYHSFKMQQ